MPHKLVFMDRPTGYEPLYTLKRVARDVWIADGGWIRFYGLPFPTRMTVIRLHDGGIWVHSPVAAEPALVEAVNGLGPVRHLIAPNWIHYAWLPDWQAAFPRAQSWGSPGVAERAAGRGVRLHLDHILNDHAPPDWAGEMDQALADSGLHREAVFFHRASRTLVLTDLIENFEGPKMPWWTQPLLWLGRVRDPDGQIPRDMAVSFHRKPAAARAVFRTMIGWAPERVIFAHGRWYAHDGAAELRRAFRSVL